MSLLASRARRFYDPWEGLPQEKRRILIRENLDAYIRFAADSVPYYRERLALYDPKAEFPLLKVPALSSTDVRGLVPPASNQLVVGGTKDYTVFQSGGTTGIPKTTLFSHAELEGLNLPNARGFFALGLQESDRVANLFAVGALYMTFIHINRMLQQYGCMNFPFSNYAPPDFVHTVTKLFNVNVFTGIASVVMNCLRGMSEIGAEGIQIEKIFYGGEHLYEADKQEIRNRFGTKIIAAPGYGTVDTWYLGYQCLDCPTGVFHAHDDQSYMEIIDEDSGDPCSNGVVGMLYATALPRRLTPIVRYRVGDRAKWIGEPCSCGRTTPLFKLLGRGDDVLRIGYDSIDYNAIQEAVLKVKGLTGTVQMEKQREQGRDRLVLRIETELPAPSHGDAAAELEKVILDARPTWRDFTNKGITWPLKIELVTLGGLPRNPRTGKLIRVVDAAAEG